MNCFKRLYIFKEPLQTLFFNVCLISDLPTVTIVHIFTFRIWITCVFKEFIRGKNVYPGYESSRHPIIHNIRLYRDEN